MKSVVIIVIAVVFLFIPINSYALEVPTWIKNTAGWWAEDRISDEEFLNAINFLKESNIIHIANNANFNSTIDSKINMEYHNDKNKESIDGYSSISDALKNPKKLQINTYEITGELENSGSKTPITINVLKPNGENQIIKVLTHMGKYSTIMKDNENTIPGIYTIEIKNGENIIETRYVFLDGSIEKIPEWIKNNARWWSNDQISDDDFLSGLQFLVETEMLKPAISSESSISVHDHKNIELLALFEDNVSTKVNLEDFQMVFNKIGKYDKVDYQAILPHLEGSTSVQDCMLKAQTNDGSISSVEKGFCEQKNRVYFDDNAGYYARDNDGNILPRPSRPDHHGGYDVGYYSTPGNFGSTSFDSNYDYSNYYSSNYGYSDADVQRYLDRADYYANKWINDITPYTQKYGNGEISLDEYERIGMQSLDYYANQFVNEFDD